MSGKAAKTNFGGEINRIQSKTDAGNPSLSSEKSTIGTIVDVRLPSEPFKREGTGILIQVNFDEKVYQKYQNLWLRLKADFHSIISSIGNRQAFLLNPPRIIYYFSPTHFDQGHAELICDNKQEAQLQEHVKNRSNAFVSVLPGLATDNRPI